MGPDQPMRGPEQNYFQPLMIPGLGLRFYISIFSESVPNLSHIFVLLGWAAPEVVIMFARESPFQNPPTSQLSGDWDISGVLPLMKKLISLRHVYKSLKVEVGQITLL